jgi:hypothetical protein
MIRFFKGLWDVVVMSWIFANDKELQEEIKAEQAQEDYERENKIGAYKES